jgi:hypothetical protein
MTAGWEAAKARRMGITTIAPQLKPPPDSL